MCRNLPPRNFAGLVLVSICVLILAASTVPAISPQAPMGQYPQASIRRDVRSRSCFSARMLWWIGSAPTRAGAWISTWIPRTCTRRRMSDKACAGGCATAIGGPNTWRTATCECIVDHRSSRVERAHYGAQADNTGWPGGPAYPGGPGGPGIPNYPRVRVDTSGSSSRSVGNVNITRGFVDSAGARPSISLRGGNFRITFYGVVENSVGGGFTMRITGSDRGDARGTAQARFNQDLNEVELINVSGRIGRDDFSGNFNCR
jgi:hypothetical protein